MHLGARRSCWAEFVRPVIVADGGAESNRCRLPLVPVDETVRGLLDRLSLCVRCWVDDFMLACFPRPLSSTAPPLFSAGTPEWMHRCHHLCERALSLFPPALAVLGRPTARSVRAERASF